MQKQFYIIKGLIRTFYIDNKGNEQIVQSGIENWWITNMESFIRETPSKLYIQALEETSALIISKRNLEKLYPSMSKFERLLRMITENILIAIQRRNDFIMCNLMILTTNIVMLTTPLISL